MRQFILKVVGSFVLLTIACLFSWAAEDESLGLLSCVHAEHGATSITPADIKSSQTSDEISYDMIEELTRTKYTSVLNGTPKSWKPGTRQFAPSDKPIVFSMESILPPTQQELNKWSGNTIVRPVPYPYFYALSVPNDTCGSLLADHFYSHTLFSRRFGIDFTGSFFPYGEICRFNGRDILRSVYAGGWRHPVTIPIDIEGDQLDSLMLFLNYYYRGWIDHIHGGWSIGEGFPFSLIVPVDRLLEDDKELSIDLELMSTVIQKLVGQGYLLDMEASEGIESFELVITDGNEIDHHVVYQRPLHGRQGWDISERNRSELAKVFLQFRHEQNKKPLNGFRECRPPEIKAVKLVVKGHKGSLIRVKALREFTFSRELVESQMNFLKSLNVLPIASTGHSGLTSYSMLSPHIGQHACIPVVDIRSGHKREICREPFGDRPGTPMHFSDMLSEFGIRFLNTVDYKRKHLTLSDVLTDKELLDGTKVYYSPRFNFVWKDPELVPWESKQTQLAENLGPSIFRFLQTTRQFGSCGILYTHHHLFSDEMFIDAKGNENYFQYVKALHPTTQLAAKALSNLKYNLDGERNFYQRVWVVPFSVLLRYAAALRFLNDHVEYRDNTIFITPWKDVVEGCIKPDTRYPTQDLHGQTFYVSDSHTARVFCRGKEITSLKRNPPDFTGRPSVTIVDVNTPTTVFDEVDLYELNGRVFQQNASVYFQKKIAYTGDYSLEVQSEADGPGMITFKPFRFDNHETDFVQFAYKKTNPSTHVFFRWTDRAGNSFAVSDGECDADRVYRIPHFEDTLYHEVIVEYSDGCSVKRNTGKIPRCYIGSLTWGVTDAKKGDSVFFDNVQFLGARGLRPTLSTTCVVGGRLTPHKDGEVVYLRVAGHVMKAATSRGGWFLFNEIPKDSVVEISYRSDGVEYYPVRGRVAQIKRNDLEYHIWAVDPRNNSVPMTIPVQTKVTRKHYPRGGGSHDLRDRYNAMFKQHGKRQYWGQIGRDMDHVVEETANNYGWPDKDRRRENPDNSLRILLLGNCWFQGQQVVTAHRCSTFLESLLRRRTGLNVEVINASTSSGNVGEHAATYQKYGRRFKPHIVLLILNAHNPFDTDPNLLERRYGWAKGHAPNKTYDFDKNGNLISYTPDPNFLAHLVQPNMAPLINKVPFLDSYFATCNYPPILQRALHLIAAIQKNEIISDAEESGAKTTLFYGFMETIYPQYGKKCGDISLARETWFNTLEDLCFQTGAYSVNLQSEGVFHENHKFRLLFESNSHPTPFGHYRLATAFANKILELPYFIDIVRKLQKP